MTHLKTIGLTALKDRQGITNALAKLKREREAGGGGDPGAPAPARKFNPKGLKKYVGPNACSELYDVTPLGPAPASDSASVSGAK